MKKHLWTVVVGVAVTIAGRLAGVEFMDLVGGLLVGWGLAGVLFGDD